MLLSDLFENDAQLAEKWSAKYKRSINCSNPKGFSQRAHCQGRNKTKEDVSEGLTAKDPVERWIAVFKNSKHPKFSNKTPQQREAMARAAQYRAVQNKKFDEELSEGPVWDKIKKTAATGAIAGALGYGAMHNAMKPDTPPQVERPPLEINIPGNDAKQPEQKKAEPKDEKPIPSTATNVDPRMEKLVFQIALKDGLRGHELAQFMAQVAHETLGFTRMVETGDSNYFKRYDPKYSPKKAKILGNVKPGDGERFKGRGFLQITGRYNYKKAGEALGIDLVKNPKLAADPKVAAEIAVWYWKSRVSPNVEDFTDTIGVTTQINPSMSGVGDRDLNYHSYARRMKLATNENIDENFADGKKPGRKGLAKRVGVNCKQSVTKLRKIASNSSGERQRMAHWCANMKGGKKK